MHSYRNIYFLVLLVLLVENISCNAKQKKQETKLCKVQVAFEPGFYNGSRIDTLIFSKAHFVDTSKEIKQLANYVAQHNIKIEAGEMTISALSVFERKYSKTININSDTSIIFQKNDFATVFEQTEIWDKDLILKKYDTVVVYYFNGNCFTTNEFASVRKISCFKNDTNYLIKYTAIPRGTEEVRSAYKTKKCSSGFLNSLNSFYLEAKEEKEKKQEITSTGNAFMFIRVGNKIFQITDPTFSIGKIYDKLVKEIKGS